eukprot:2724881-Rhodomonas_salina.6
MQGTRTEALSATTGFCIVLCSQCHDAMRGTEIAYAGGGISGCTASISGITCCFSPTRTLRNVRCWSAIPLCAGYAMPGTGVAYAVVRLRARYAMSGTVIARAASRYAFAVRCPILA